MKLFKALFSIIVVLAVALGINATAFAVSGSYELTVPEGFTSFDAEGQAAAWKNADGTVIINLAVSENTSNVKVNPNDAGQSYITALENEMKATVKQNPDLSGSVAEIHSELMELGEHDALRIYMKANYTFGNNQISVYQLCYVFETVNYIHAFVVTGEEDISSFADEFIKTVRINDEAVARRTQDDDGFLSSVAGGAIKGALIGAAVGVALALIKKFSGKKEKAQEQEAPVDYEINDADETEDSENNEQHARL